MILIIVNSAQRGDADGETDGAGAERGKADGGEADFGAEDAGSRGTGFGAPTSKDAHSPARNGSRVALTLSTSPV